MIYVNLTAGERVEKFYTGIIQDSMGLGREFTFKGNFVISEGYISLENDEQRDYFDVREITDGDTFTRLTQKEIQALDLYNTIEDYLNSKEEV